jgi:mRNA interferase MazF
MRQIFITKWIPALLWELKFGDPMSYITDRREIVWINLNPQAGHEQAGRRPVLVLSPAAYNGKVGLVVFCPITNQI